MSIASRPDGLRHVYALVLTVFALLVAPAWAADESPEALQKRCDGGDGAACNALGLLYDNGTTVTKDRKQAGRLFRLACDLKHGDGCEIIEARELITDRMVFNEIRRPAEGLCAEGNSVACYEIGALYYDGFESIAPDWKVSAQYFQKACDGGHAVACKGLGIQYLNGQGIAKNTAQAVTLFVGACSANEPNACLILGSLHSDGDGVAKDLAKAASWYSRACELNDWFGCNVMGSAYRDGEGVPKDEQRATEMYAKACQLGDDVSCALEAMLTPESKPESAAEPTAAGPSAIELEARCKAKDWAACADLGFRYQKGEGVPMDDAKAAALAQKACAGGYASSCTGVGFRHLFGDGLPKDLPKAAAMFEKACAGNDGFGCNALGLMHETNQGGIMDPAKAAALIAKACKLGHKESCDHQARKTAAAATPAKAPAATTAATKPASAACKIVKMQLGVDTVASVERDIQARGGSTSSGTGLGKYRLSAISGDYPDGGTDVMAVNYDFDANAPTGRLIAVTIVNHANTGPGYEKLLAARKAAAAAITGPLQQKSATEFIASAPNCTLRFLPNADSWFVYEVYELPKSPQ